MNLITHEHGCGTGHTWIVEMAYNENDDLLPVHLLDLECPECGRPGHDITGYNTLEDDNFEWGTVNVPRLLAPYIVLALTVTIGIMECAYFSNC